MSAIEYITRNPQTINQAMRCFACGFCYFGEEIPPDFDRLKKYGCRKCFCRAQFELMPIAGEGKWIKFILLGEKPKTKIWLVLTSDGTTDLGLVEWFPRWRGYAFSPMANTFFERVCLRDIAEFIELQNKRHWARVKESRRNKSDV